MRLRLVKEPFDDPEFIFELKHDGFRALAYIEDGSQAGYPAALVCLG
jgi:ATP-dependent DNA ligase